MLLSQDSKIVDSQLLNHHKFGFGKTEISMIWPRHSRAIIYTLNHAKWVLTEHSTELKVNTPYFKVFSLFDVTSLFRHLSISRAQHDFSPADCFRRDAIVMDTCSKRPISVGPNID